MWKLGRYRKPMAVSSMLCAMIAQSPGWLASATRAAIAPSRCGAPPALVPRVHPPALHTPPPMASTPIAKADFIEGMAKGMAVLESFDTERQRLNATLAAQRTGLTRAAARRHLLTL
eukprot:gene26797-48227_t